MARNIGINIATPQKECKDEHCPFHGTLSVRGRLFSGRIVSNRAKNMIVVEHAYPHLIKKYKRYERSKSRIHAYLPPCMNVKEDETVKIAECKPLSKTVSFVVIEVSGKDGSQD